MHATATRVELVRGGLWTRSHRSAGLLHPDLDFVLDGVYGVFRALVWPAFLVDGALHSLKL